MSVQAELPFERFRYWQGQMVRARDFTAQLAEVERLGRWHQRAIHNAFGIRFGFDVTRQVSPESARPLGVRIECGVAFDCSGGLLVLQRPRELDVPALQAGESVGLIVRARHASGGCGCHGAEMSPRAGEPRLWEDDLVFTWSQDRHNDPREGVPLARVTRELSGEIAVDSSVRTLTRPFVRPRLGSGSTIAGLTAWEPWAAGMQTRIDTAAAGFTQTPAYAACVIATAAPLSFREVPLFFTHVADPGLTEFTFRILAPPLARASVESTRIQPLKADRRGLRTRVRVVVAAGASLRAFQPGDTVRLVAPGQSGGLQGAPAARVERIDPDGATITVSLDRSADVDRNLEAVQIVRLHSDDFQLRFVETARTLGLTVCWLGCQHAEFEPPDCPGQHKTGVPCCDAEPGTE